MNSRDFQSKSYISSIEHKEVFETTEKAEKGGAIRYHVIAENKYRKRRLPIRNTPLDGDNRALTATFGNGKVMTNTYDAIGRITQRRLGLNSNYDTALTYKPGADGSQTALLATYQNGGDTPYSYEYDANGNITEITQGNVSVTYSYNAANELIRENNGFTNQTVTYAYDNWGNITEKDVYAYTTATDPGTPMQTIPYAYTNSSWGDQLTSYNNQSILYDAMGNPTSYLGQTLTWEGKQLTAAGTTTYEYDENGLRLNKTVNNVSTDYYYNGSVLMSLVTGNDTLLFSYDASGKVVAVNHNGTYYYYLRNGQGDIVKLIDNSGATVVEYSYDTWGKQLSCTGSLASTLGTLNPFRYRGYVYDEETGFYYLRSRYYDPTTCRFISADVLLSTGQGVLGHNAYAYCGNNPVNRIDDEGEFWNIVIGAVAGAIFGAVIAAVNGGDVKDIIVGALVGSAVGALVGMGVGAAVGAIAGGAAAGTAAAATGGAAVASITTTQAAGLAVAAGAAVVVGTNAAVEVAKKTNIVYSKSSKQSGKERASNKPSWVNKDMVNPSKSAQSNAQEMLNDKYGIGNWKTGANSEYNKIVKWIIRSFLLR